MKFPKKILQNLAYDDHDVTAYEVMENEICDHSRWSVQYYMVFKVLATSKFYCTCYSRGATEQQDESPYEYAGAEVECAEVEPKKKEVIDYVKVKESATNESV